MSSIDVLYGAAKLMRARAENAPEGPWGIFGTAGVSAPSCDPVPEQLIATRMNGDEISMAGCDHPDTAEHIAGWDPIVALAVSRWLYRVADDWNRCGEAELASALAVAHAYLGAGGATNQQQPDTYN